MTAEWGIPVMFDVTAPNRTQAAVYLNEQLGRARPFLMGWESDRANVESWWFIEAEDKPVDRNDNGAGRVVFDVEDDDPAAAFRAIGGWMFQVPVDDGEDEVGTLRLAFRDGEGSVVKRVDLSGEQCMVLAYGLLHRIAWQRLDVSPDEDDERVSFDEGSE